MIEYYVSNRTALIRNKETGYVITIPSSEPAYILAKNFILNNQISQLHFFTDIGFTIKLGNTIIESTQTRCFNIHFPDASYSTLPSMYDDVISLILDNNSNLTPLIEKLRIIAVNKKIFEGISDNNIIVNIDNVIIKGKYGNYNIDFDKLSVYITPYNGKPTSWVCMHIENNNYTSPNINEKELCILSKALYCLNDSIFFPNDPVLKKFTEPKS